MFKKTFVIIKQFRLTKVKGVFSIKILYYPFPCKDLGN